MAAIYIFDQQKSLLLNLLHILRGIILYHKLIIIVFSEQSYSCLQTLLRALRIPHERAILLRYSGQLGKELLEHVKKETGIFPEVLLASEDTARQFYGLLLIDHLEPLDAALQGQKA
ncbi:MAG: hypothetical protein GXO42_03160 [bacterium]|nr:hypothetical protein [bacterium]